MIVSVFIVRVFFMVHDVLQKRWTIFIVLSIGFEFEFEFYF
jgi:hypothetical protein